MPRLLGGILLFCLAVSSFAQSQPCPPPTPPGKCDSATGLNSVLYFRSRPQDADRSICGLTVVNGRVVASTRATNPALTCPDTFSWKLFVDVIQQNFWADWSTDQQTWPGQPYPLCNGSNRPNCCQAGSLTGDPAHCPFFPGAQTASAKALPQIRMGVPPSKAHIPGFIRSRALTAANASGTDPDRAIRQSMAEIVFRNQPMVDYVTRADLYNQEGIVGVLKRVSANMQAGLPYRGQTTGGANVEVSFPPEAIMIKSDWIRSDKAGDYGVSWDPANPFITMPIQVTDWIDDKPVQKVVQCWLIAFHISSKDTPNWVWTTFEHVNNPGRCDFIGCNDSYGYASADVVQPGQATNYTRPNTKCDNLDAANTVFDNGKTYKSGPVNPDLGNLFIMLGIGTNPAPPQPPASGNPTPADYAWRSYRLKGSQVEFTDSMGNPTLLGNSITEAGFTTTSSCISCHARAGVNLQGTIPPALGVFINEITEHGYLQSTRGVPNPEWYNASRQPPAQVVLQTDFVWGVLNALCLYPCSGSCPNPGPDCPCTPPPTVLNKAPGALQQPAARRSPRDVIHP